MVKKWLLSIKNESNYNDINNSSYMLIKFDKETLYIYKSYWINIIIKG